MLGVRDIKHHNELLMNNIKIFIRKIKSAKFPESIGQYIEPYRDYLLSNCDNLVEKIKENLDDLDKNPQLIKVVISNTNEVGIQYHLMCCYVNGIILRVTDEDALIFSLISWMHNTHTQTKSIPTFICDGEPAIFLYEKLAPVYYFPTLEQRTLLFLPLLFHEFGHLLNNLHREKMNLLIDELQQSVDTLPVYMDRQSAKLFTKLTWIVEYFCDAVGFQIAGESYLWAFSNYASRMKKDDYHLPDNQLYQRTHPLTYLRIKLLSRRAIDNGFIEAAEEIDSQWMNVAKILNIDTESTTGVYADKNLEDKVYKTVSDMIELVQPGGNWLDTGDLQNLPIEWASPPQLLNDAWKNYRNRKEDYLDWEETAIKSYVDSVVSLPPNSPSSSIEELDSPEVRRDGIGVPLEVDPRQEPFILHND